MRPLTVLLIDIAQRAGEIAMSPSLRGVIAHEAAALVLQMREIDL